MAGLPVRHPSWGSGRGRSWPSDSGCRPQLRPWYGVEYLIRGGRQRGVCAKQTFTPKRMDAARSRRMVLLPRNLPSESARALRTMEAPAKPGVSGGEDA